MTNFDLMQSHHLNMAFCDIPIDLFLWVSEYITQWISEFVVNAV